MTSEEILAELAAQTDAIREFSGVTFEGLEDYWAICDARLSAFSSEKMWAVAIEVVGYDRAENYEVRVYLFGNCVQESESAFQRTVLTVPNAWNKEIKKNQIWGLSREGFALRFRGRRLDFAPSLDELQAAGIELSEREIESGELSPQQMLRFVCEKLEHPFFLSEDGLRDVLDSQGIDFQEEYDRETERSWFENELGEFDEPPLLSAILELVLQTRDWIHPKLGIADEGKWEISPREAFETLAETLATRDLAVWEAQDETKFNSHWRNWAEIEADKDRAQAEATAAEIAAFRAFVEAMPVEARADFLGAVRSSIAEAPLISEWSSQAFVELNGVELRIFRELLPEVDALLAESRNA